MHYASLFVVFFPLVHIAVSYWAPKGGAGVFGSWLRSGWISACLARVWRDEPPPSVSLEPVTYREILGPGDVKRRAIGSSNSNCCSCFAIEMMRFCIGSLQVPLLEPVANGIATCLSETVRVLGSESFSTNTRSLCFYV